MVSLAHGCNPGVRDDPHRAHRAGRMLPLVPGTQLPSRALLRIVRRMPGRAPTNPGVAYGVSERETWGRHARGVHRQSTEPIPDSLEDGHPAMHRSHRRRIPSDRCRTRPEPPASVMSRDRTRHTRQGLGPAGRGQCAYAPRSGPARRSARTARHSRKPATHATPSPRAPRRRPRRSMPHAVRRRPTSRTADPGRVSAPLSLRAASIGWATEAARIAQPPLDREIRSIRRCGAPRRPHRLSPTSSA